MAEVVSLKMAAIISHQFQLFLISFAYGMLLGVWYDFFRSLRKKISHRNGTVHMEDAVFCITAAGGLFALFQVYNQGVVRFYCLVGIWCGALIYFIFFGELVERFWRLAISVSEAVLKTGNKMLIVPVKIIVKNVVKTLKNAAKTIRIIKDCK